MKRQIRRRIEATYLLGVRAAVTGTEKPMGLDGAYSEGFTFGLTVLQLARTNAINYSKKVVDETTEAS